MNTIFEKTERFYNEHGCFDYYFRIDESEDDISLVGGLEDRIDRYFNRDKETPDISSYINCLNILNCNPGCNPEQELIRTYNDNPIPMAILKDELIEYLADHRDEFTEVAMISNIKKMVFETENIYTLNFAITVYNALDYLDKKVEDAVVLFAKIGETAEYCIPVIMKRKDRNDVLREVIEESCGYAKRYAVNNFEPENKEDEIWLLHNGTDYFISYYGSAVSLTKKCHILDMIKDPDLEDEDYSEIGRIVGSYFSEGPADGLNEIDWVEIMLEYIDLVKRRPTEGGLHGIYLMTSYIDFGMKHTVPKKLINKVMNPAKELWNSKEIRDYVRKQVDNYSYFHIAKEMRIAHVDKAFKKFCMDPVNNSYLIQYFEGNYRYMKKAIKDNVCKIDFNKGEIKEKNYSDEELNLIYFFVDAAPFFPEYAEELVYMCVNSTINTICSKGRGAVYYWGCRNMSPSERTRELYDKMVAEGSCDYLDIFYGVKNNESNDAEKITTFIEEKLTDKNETIS